MNDTTEKLNMQMTDAEPPIRPLSELNLADDFLFDVKIQKPFLIPVMIV